MLVVLFGKSCLGLYGTYLIETAKTTSHNCGWHQANWKICIVCHLLDQILWINLTMHLITHVLRVLFPPSSLQREKHLTWANAWNKTIKQKLLDREPRHLQQVCVKNLKHELKSSGSWKHSSLPTCNWLSHRWSQLPSQFYLKCVIKVMQRKKW